MGDTIPLDWGTLGTQPNPNAFMQGYNNARTIAQNAVADHARDAALANPSDMNALTRFAVFNPPAAEAIKSVLDYQRQGQARDSYADAVLAMRPQNALMPSTAQTSYQPATAAQQAPAAPALPPVAPGTGFQNAFAPVAQGALGSTPPPQPQGAPQGQQGSVLTDPSHAMNNPDHPVSQQIGQAALQGQADPYTALAMLARFDPKSVETLVQTVSQLDTVQRTRLSDATGALGGAAEKLLHTPPEQRAALLQQLAPELLQHGITVAQLQQALSTGLSDQYLSGVIGISQTTKGAVEQSNSDRTYALDVTKQQEVTRHNLADERNTGIKTMAPGSSIVDTNGPGGSASVSPAAGAYAAALTQAGLPANAVAGFVGNLQVESGFNPSAVGDGGQAVGVAQWHPDRAAAFKAMFGVAPSAGSPQQVAQFIKAEISRLPAAQQQAILNAPDPASAAAAVDQYFERSNGAARNQRMAAATAWAGGGKVIASNEAGTLTGDALDAAAIIYAKTGQMPQNLGRNGVNGTAIMTRLAQMSKESGIPISDLPSKWQDYKAAGGTLKAFEYGPESKIVRSINVATGHIEALGAAADALQNGDMKLFNRIAQSWASAFGKAAPTNFDSLKEIVADEVLKAVLGSGAGGQGDREAMKATIMHQNSPEQLHGVMNGWLHLMGQQVSGLRQSYTAGTGRQDFDRFLNPTVRRVFGAGGNDSSAPPAPAIAALKGNPTLRAMFDQKYGAGSAARVLGN